MDTDTLKRGFIKKGFKGFCFRNEVIIKTCATDKNILCREEKLKYLSTQATR